MSSLINAAEVQTMSSREIAELTGKQHGHVCRDIRVMLSELGISEQSKIGFVERINNLGHAVKDKVYLLNKEESLCLVAGYGAALRMKIINRWQELEEQESKPTFPVPQTYLEALKALVVAEEEKERLALVIVG